MTHDITKVALGNGLFRRATANEKATGAPTVILPPEPAPRCVHFGAATGEQVPCAEGCKYQAKLNVFGCAVHGRCTPETRGVGVPGCCTHCEERTPQVLQVKVTADGLGDHLLGLTTVAGLRAQYPDARLLYVCKHAGLVEWCRLMDVDCEIVAAPLGGVRTYQPHDTYARQMEEHTVKGRWVYYAEACGTTAVLPLPRPLPAGARAWAAPDAGCVVLAPFTAKYQDRDWPKPHWLDLEQRLLATGRRVVIVDNHGPPRTAGFRSPVLAESPARLAALVGGASCVVGNDSGLSHLAGMMRTPTIVLCGPVEGEKVYGIYPTVRVLDGPLSCTGCHWRGAARAAAGCTTTCASLHAIAPAEVLAAIDALAPPLTPAAERAVQFAGRLARLTTANRSFAGGTVDRRPTMTAFIERFLRVATPHVVETGCQRGDDDYGAGMSTSLFGLALSAHGAGRLTSLELDPARAAFARARVGANVDVIVTDSRVWLRRYGGPSIDALYLDSMDMELPGHEECCLEEAQAALPHLSPAALILIDDTVRVGNGWRGKGTQAIPWLLARGWRIVAEGYQVLLARP